MNPMDAQKKAGRYAGALRSLPDSKTDAWANRPGDGFAAESELYQHRALHTYPFIKFGSPTLRKSFEKPARDFSSGGPLRFE